MTSKSTNDKLSELVGSIDSEINNKTSSSNNVSIDDITNLKNSLSSTIKYSSDEETWFQKNYISVILGTLLFLLLIGVNLILFLSQGTSDIYNNLQPYLTNIVGVFGFTLTETTKSVVDTSATGSKGVIDTAAKSLTNSADGTDRILQNSVNGTRTKKKNQITRSDSSTSKVQRQNTNVKGGWCYIGEDKGIRTCAKVNDSNLCLSNQVFDSEETCEYVGMRP
tara:strand:+ start:1789 stop:2457 length:669 start_codon:yes stop_codon:yes gene_type:complete